MDINVSVIENVIDSIKNNEKLYDATEKLIYGTKVYDEKFSSSVNKRYDKECNILIKNIFAFDIAERFVEKYEKVAILNFTHPTAIGDDIHSGTNAYEDYLFKESNLYYSLESKEANEKFYSPNIELLKNNIKVLFNYIASDRIIYSPNTAVFKEDDACNGMSDARFNVDVITCSPPCVLKCPTGSESIDKKVELFLEEFLLDILVSRIKNILEVAIENNIDAFVLSALGCYGYNIPPSKVAEAFHIVFSMERYKYAFKKVVFSIKVDEELDNINIKAFSKFFSR